MVQLTSENYNTHRMMTIMQDNELCNFESSCDHEKKAEMGCLLYKVHRLTLYVIARHQKREMLSDLVSCS